MAEGFVITVRAGDSILARYGNQLAALHGGLARTVLARALNHEGDKARTKVKRVLVAQTGINYNLINRAVATHRANRGNLRYELRASGRETNLALFQARQTLSGVSAAPWKSRHIFRGDSPPRASFFLPGTGDVYIREGGARYDVGPLFGPNLAREIVKDESAHAWRTVLPSLASRVGHEISRALSNVT